MAHVVFMDIVGYSKLPMASLPADGTACTLGVEA
jgi:hypothetical protein